VNIFVLSSWMAHFGGWRGARVRICDHASLLEDADTWDDDADGSEAEDCESESAKR